MVAAPTDSSRHEPSPTLQDLKRLAWAVVLIELAIAGLALFTRAYFGARLTLFVGLALGGLVLTGFVLVVLFSLAATTVEDLLVRRGRRRKERRVE